MNLLSRFKEYIQSNNLFHTKDKLLLAVSGGIDSVALCELCKQAGFDFAIAHCNFQLRGEESERDEEFVRKLSKKYEVEVYVERFETEKYAAENKIAIQEAARDLRYSWFFTLWYEMPNALALTEPVGETIPGWHVHSLRVFVLTAHQADDNAETVLMNFCRGTGLHGLTGIPVSGPSGVLNYIRRPLLPFTRKEIESFINEHKLEFVEDSSNTSTKYTRNFFRHDVIPAIGKIYPEVTSNLLDNIERFKEIEKLYRLSVDGILKKICKQKGNEVHIPVKQLMSYNNRALIYEIIYKYNFSEKQIDELIKLGKSDSGKYIQSASEDFRIIKHRHWFIISPVMPFESENIIIEEKDKKVNFAIGSLDFQTVETANCKLQTANSIAQLDLKEVKFPLLLRRWKTGDYFYPLGMRKKKKVARFLIDQKLSKTDKEKIWVIESDKRILWIVNHRIDDRFKITSQTKSVLKITLEN